MNNEPPENHEAANELLAKLQNFEDMLSQAPEDPTPDECAAMDSDAAVKALEERRRVILSKEAGWPSKSLWSVQNEQLLCRKWMMAFLDAERVLKKGGIVILHGDRGTGKTRMAAELAVFLWKTEYRKAMGFFLDVRATYKAKSKLTERDVIDELATAKMLVIDEIQVRGGKPFEDNLLTHLVDLRYAERLPTVLIANLPSDQLAESLGASIVDRISENGAVILCDWPSFRGTEKNKQ